MEVGGGGAGEPLVGGGGVGGCVEVEEIGVGELGVVVLLGAEQGGV